MILRFFRPLKFLTLIAASALLAVQAHARTWKSADGSKTFEGELISYDPNSGTVEVNINGAPGSFDHSLLSDEDIEYLRSQTSVPVSVSALAAPDGTFAAKPLEMSRKIEYLLEDHCWKCHDYGTQKGDIRLDNLAELTLEARLDLLNRAQEQAHFKQMPPPDEKTQPTDEERKDLLAWISGELHAHNASKLEEKLRYPAYGNAIDHDQLFNGQISEPAYTPARRWLVSPQIFDQRVEEIFELEGRERGRGFYGVTNPFLLPDASGVRYYDNGVLDGGHLLVMLTNADWISSKQLRPARVKSGEIEAKEFPDPRDRWSPRATPEAFETVILKKGQPTDSEISAAIGKQFQLVLQREPDSGELAKYLELTRTFIGLGGNTEGLRQMLVAVLLESEFLYRLEFGAGNPDAYGRKMLSPREGAYAISYALGDRGPDAGLMEAAENGKLESREDYHREVTRLLEDKEYYKGSVDPAFTTGKVTSHVTSHPRINRFFRDFFGYPTAIKVFKDSERSEGYYRNPGRGTLATPGFLVNEADRIVDWFLQKDQDVFNNLLTSDQFFVYHDRSNEEGGKIIKEWREVYDALKSTSWKSNPEKVLEKHAKFISERPSMRSLNAERPGELVNFMHFFDEYFGEGRTPFTTIPWAHGYTFHHSPFYNLPPTPSIGRYGSWKSTELRELEKTEFWDYPVEQPFKIPNRKGILTHPAWLIAHSKNTHNDPVVRGKWVREKLLAGRVPDVPITVDAQIPEDHDKTLRDRLEMVTLEEDCWKCHQHMNPLGLPFEIYDDFGRYRTEEPLEHADNVVGRNGRYDIYKTLKIDSKGALTGTGNPQLDGEVDDALELIERVANSDRARQSIIRHAFRFYMGRNEMPSDSKTLIDADKAYLESGGSFKAVIVSLLTSDSFIYRK
jgi:hypothetical protein